MVNTHYPKSRRPSSKGSPQETLILILFLIVAVESFWLYRIYFKKEPTPRASAVSRTKTVPVIPFIKPQPFESPVPKPQPPQRIVGKIAIIIDDNGYSGHDCPIVEKIASPITISVLPNLPHSKEISQCAHDNNKEVMLHLPMEAHINKEKYPEDYIIKIAMSDKRVIRRLDKALATVPFAEGVNNHMGSKATEDRHLMSVLFTQLQEKGLFFVDSRVTTQSVCPALAQEKGLPFGQRDVFLDNENNRAYIEQQFFELSEKARRKGKAIGIGHARPLTWEIVQEQVRKLTQDGFQIVPVKELLTSP